MNRKHQKYLITLITCIILITGCSSHPQQKNRTNDSSTGSVEAYHTNFEQSSLRTYIDIYGTKLFYMEILDTSADFYIYDFSTTDKQKIETIPNFALKGRSNTRIDDTLYFYLSIYNGDDLDNLLYAMDYKDLKMSLVSENTYAQKLIPVVGMDDEIVALQGDSSKNDSSNETFFEIIDTQGDTKKVDLPENETASDSDNSSQSIIYFDGDDDFLYAFEKNIVNSSIEYDYVKYDSDFTCIQSIDITDLFSNYEITDNIGVFYAFDHYFCMTDLSSNSILCEVNDDDLKVLLCENSLEYVDNTLEDLTYQFFYIRNTNDIYRLNVQTGEIEIQNYNLDEDSAEIRCVLAYDNTLAIIKNATDDNPKESIYFIPKVDQPE